MLKKLLKLAAVGRVILKKPWLLNAVLEVEDLWRDTFRKKYPALPELPEISFIELCSADPEPAEPYAYLEGGSLPTDISLLRSMAKRFEDCKYFEIGAWRGESVANVAVVAKECVTVNLSPEEIKKQGGSSAYADAHFFFSQGLPNVQHILTSTLNLDFQALNKKFDVIFIDGDHHYEMVLHDTRKVFQHLVHENSIVVWHDYAFNPEIVRYEVYMAILDSLPQSKHSHLYHVSNTLCAIYLPFEITGKIKSYPQQPEGYFRVDLTWREL
ncbi:MAG: class I SAM-dependent methyltransferase [Bacteroidales bacterium]